MIAIPDGRRGLLASRRFLPLFLTQFLGAFNDNLFKNATVVLLLFGLADQARDGTGDALLATIAAGLFILPFALFSASAGRLADRVDKARLVRATKTAEIAIMAGGAVALLTGSVPGLLAVLFLMGSQSALFGPVKYGILPDHLSDRQLGPGNALIEAATFLAILLGTISGGLLAGAEDGAAVAAAAVLALAVAGRLTAQAVPTAPPVPGAGDGPLFAPVRHTRAVLAEVMGRSDLRPVVLGIGGFWFLGAVYLSQMPAFVRDVLGGDEGVATLLLALFSLGIGLGAFLAGRLLKDGPSARPVPAAALAMAGFAAALAAVVAGLPQPAAVPAVGWQGLLARPEGLAVAGLMLGLAVAGGIYSVPLYALLQSRAPKGRKASAIAALNIVNAGMVAGSALLCAGLLAAGTGVAGLFAAAAVAAALLAAMVLRRLAYEAMQSALRLVLRLAYRVEVQGLEHLAAAGPRAIVAPNHQSFLDAPLLAAFLPGRVAFAVDVHQTRHWWVRLAMAVVQAFPVNSASPLAARSLIREVRRDRRVVVFPEGRLTATAKLMKVYPGAALVADRSGAPIVPVRIDGAERTPFSRLGGVLRRRWFPKIRITVLPPRTLDVPQVAVGRTRRTIATDRLHRLLTEMMFDTRAPERPLFDELLSAARRHGGGSEIVEDQNRRPLTYDRLVLASLVLGRRLAREAGKGETIGLLLPTAVPTAAAFLGCQAFGRVPAMLNATAGPAALASAVDAARIRTVVTARAFVDKARLGPTLDALAARTGVRLLYLEDVKGDLGLSAKLRGLADRLRARHLRWRSGRGVDDPAAILFTSGSEGRPKGVVLSHRNLVANCRQAGALVDFTPRDVVLNALPLFHSFGLTGGLLLPVLSGVKTVLYPSPLHYRVVPEMAYMANATILFGTDTFLAGYARVAHPYDFYRVRLAFAGAERVREETRRIWMERFGVRLLEGYGATECAPVIALNTPMHNRAGTVGRFVPGLEIRLVSVDGVPDGLRLLVRGPNVMRGYLTDDRPGDLQPPPDGWYDTGDLVRLDADGFVTVVGRVKRFAKIAGEMVSLPAVEEALVTAWPDFAHAVVAIADPRKGQQLVCVTEAAGLDRRAAAEAVAAAGLPEIAAPRLVVPVAKLPLLGSGKVDLPACAALASEPQAA